jgi:hypothetical protein
MTRVLRPGPASIEGLTWLARVGPCPLHAWRCAMGWSDVAARSHARRLERAGWLARYPMTRGDGSLFLATRVGIEVAAVPVSAAGPPAPTWWAHHCAVAWMAAWLKLRGHEFLGGRELLEGDEWSGEISWRDRSGFKNATHRPDLVACPRGGRHIAIEVELTKKSAERLRAILWRHAVWRSNGQIGGVIYICADHEGGEHITSLAAEAGLARGRGLRVEQLDTIKAQAFAAYEEIRAARLSSGSGDARPMLAVDGS